MTSIVGFVVKINYKKGKSKKPPHKPYTLYSMRLADKGGEEIDAWFQCGFDKPDCQEGDYVKVTVEARDDGNYDVKGVAVSKNPPANPNAGKSSGGGSGGGAKQKESELFGSIGGYNTEDDIRRMSWSVARDHAIEVVSLLLEHGGLKLVKADSKAGVTSRFETITEAVDKLTVEFYFDGATGRKLETVADSFEGSPEGDGPLPDAEDDGFEDDASEEFPDTDGEFDDDPDFE
jgi:hypothetical protein